MHIDFNDLKDLLVFNIKYYRYKKGISQEALAEACKLSSRYITDIERGMHCPTIPKLELISHALDLEPYQLFINPDRDFDIVLKIQDSRQYNQNKKS